MISQESQPQYLEDSGPQKPDYQEEAFTFFKLMDGVGRELSFPILAVVKSVEFVRSLRQVCDLIDEELVQLLTAAVHHGDELLRMRIPAPSVSASSFSAPPPRTPSPRPTEPAETTAKDEPAIKKTKLELEETAENGAPDEPEKNDFNSLPVEVPSPQAGNTALSPATSQTAHDYDQSAIDLLFEDKEEVKDDDASEHSTTVGKKVHLAVRRSKKCQCTAPMPSLKDASRKIGASYYRLRKLGLTTECLSVGDIVLSVRFGFGDPRWTRARVNGVQRETGGVYLGWESEKAAGTYSSRIKDCLDCAHLLDVIAIKKG